jgi:hypothetical protein
LFLTFILSAQFYAPTYFFDKVGPFSGGGGAVGFWIALALENTIGLIGSYITIAAVGAISLLFVFNTTVITVISRLFALVGALFVRSGKEDKEEESAPKRRVEEELSRIEEAKEDKSIPQMMPFIKEMRQMPLIEVDEEPRERKPKAGKKKKRYSSYELPPLTFWTSRLPEISKGKRN